jgi:PAT family beta-lactamase induction signal transducer AmpG
LLLIVLYKLGDAFAMSLTTTFLIRGVGFDAGEVGVVNKTLGLIATIIGALWGGVLMQRLSLFRALLIFGLQAFQIPGTGCWLLRRKISSAWRQRFFWKTSAAVWARRPSSRC